MKAPRGFSMKAPRGFSMKAPRGFSIEGHEPTHPIRMD